MSKLENAIDEMEKELEERADEIEHELRNDPDAAVDLARKVLAGVKEFLHRLG